MGRRVYCPTLACNSTEQISFFYTKREEKENSRGRSFVACAVSSSLALRVKSLTELWIKHDSCNSHCLYLEVDLLGQFFSLVVLGAGVAIGGQGQEGRAHGAAARLAAEVLGPAREQTAGEVTLPQEHLSIYSTCRNLHFFKVTCDCIRPFRE